MFHQFSMSDPEEVVEGGMGVVEIPLADAKHKITFGQNPVDIVIIDASVIFVCGYQLRQLLT